MRRLTLAITLVCTLPSWAAAQERSKAPLFVLDAALRGAALADLQATYKWRGEMSVSMKEWNPLFTRVMDAGPQVSVPLSMAADTGVTFLAAKMRRSDNRFARRFWWTPQVGLMIAHLHGAIRAHNAPRY